MTTEEKISELRAFFKVSNAAFDFIAVTQLAFNRVTILNKMHQLHKIALVEIEKENPDLAIIDNLLDEMEKLAEENNQSKPNFPNGGV